MHVKLTLVALGLLSIAGLAAACAATPTPAAPSPLPSPSPLALAATITSPASPALTATTTPNTARPAATASPADTLGHHHPGTAQPAEPTRPPIATNMFTVIYGPQDFGVTPTPIATPAQAQGRYRLKAWDETDALALIATLDQYAGAADICGAFECVRGRRQQAEEPLRLAIMDTIDRFPYSPALEQLQWRLALANAIVNRSDSDQWLIGAIAKALNQDAITPGTLDNYLEKWGFRLDDPNPAYNLYGDGNPAWVYRMHTLTSERQDGLIVAVSGPVTGPFSVRLIHSHWDFDQGEDQLVGVADHNHNGLPEVVTYSGGHSGTFCGGSVLIYEWRGDHFAELTGGQIVRNDCGMSWSYDVADANGVETIQVTTPQYPPYYTDHFAWNGSSYVFSRRDYSDLSAASYDGMVARGHYGDRVALIQNAIKTAGAAAGDLGASYADYLRFQLGYEFALRSQSAAVSDTLHTLVISPTNPLTRAVPAAAQAFLQTYHGDADVYRACQAALLAMQTALPRRVPSRYSDAWSATQRTYWGFAPDALYTDGAVCDLQRAVPLLVSTIAAERLSANPVAALREMGVDVRSATPVDLKGDGPRDWIVEIEGPGSAPGEPRHRDLWVLVTDSMGIHAEYLLSEDNLSGPFTTEPTQAQLITLPGAAQPVLLFRLGARLFSIMARGSDPAGQLGAQLLATDLQDYTVETAGQTVSLIMTLLPPEFTRSPVSPESYIWDTDARAWQWVNWPEEAILRDQPPAMAIALLRASVDDTVARQTPGDDTIAQDLYLLASAYERAGDSAKAAATYWRLWHAYADSGFARIAESKLEPAP